MGKNKEKRSSLTLSEHFKLCFGILLISLSIIALTGKTAVGEFFAYCFAYLFGTFFPAFAAAFLLLGVVLVIRKKFLPVRNHSFLYLGVFLILLSITVPQVLLCLYVHHSKLSTLLFLGFSSL